MGAVRAARRRCRVTPNISQAAAALGKKGGKVKVAKGFSKMDPERRSAIAKAAAAKRWAKKEAK